MSPANQPMISSKRRPVVAIRLLSGKSGDPPSLRDNKLAAGDILETVCIGSVTLNAPFTGGKTGLQLELRRLYKAGDTLARVKVRRLNNQHVEMQVYVVPVESVMMKKQYALRATHDPHHLVALLDSTEPESLLIQEERAAEVHAQLVSTHMRHGYISYPWVKKMTQQQNHPHRLNSIFSLLIIPAAQARATQSYDDVDDTMSKAMSWLVSAQTAGIPIKIFNLQMEPLLAKIPGHEASSSSGVADSWEADAMDRGVYGYEDYHGVDIGIMRAVRLWYVPAVAEVAIHLDLRNGETKLGIGLGRTDEGFCYVSFVEDGTVAERAGLKMLLLAAKIAGKFLVVSRIGEDKITPTMVSSTGLIRCYDTMSISQKLSLHRQAGQSLRVYVLVWEGAVDLARTSAAAKVASSMFPVDVGDNTCDKKEMRHSRSVVLELVSEPESARSSSASMFTFTPTPDYHFCSPSEADFLFPISKPL